MEPICLQLSAGELRAGILPTLGGAVSYFSRDWREAGAVRRVHWLRPTTAQSVLQGEVLGTASFPLIPFCNRIRDGIATSADRDIRFPPNHPGNDSPHPLHGIAWQRAWQVLSSSAAQVSMQLDVAASMAWPWKFNALQHVSLEASGLTIELVVRNDDTAPMPLGLGHHPYFPRDERTRLTVRTRAMWATDPEVMPLQLEAGEAVTRLVNGLAVSELDLDNNFVGWDREALIEWAADANGPARALVMRAEAPLDYFVLYSPAHADYFCAEPVSQCTDWLNLADGTPAQDLGGAMVAPGETLSVRFSLLPRWC